MLLTNQKSWDEYQQDVRDFNAVRAENGWEPKQPTVAVNVVCAQTESEAWDRIVRHTTEAQISVEKHYHFSDAAHFKQAEGYKFYEAFAKTLIFLQRTQNLIEVNDFKRKIRDPDSGEWRTVAPGDDGGAAYYPGNSPAGYIEQTDGSRIPRSYGSMTYALLKAYTLCGLPPDDRRVLATIKWLGQNWALDTNPGSDPGKPEKTKYQGLFYYYMVMAQALNTAGVEELETWQGEGTQKRKVVVNWRTDLGAQIKGMQAEDGSWLNERNGRWFESQALICTAYAMLALEHCDDL